jgi:predicted nucleic acid-binding Zn ribbon protein
MSDRRDRNGPVKRPQGSSGPPGPGGEELSSVLREVLGQGSLREGVPLGRLVRGWEAVVGAHLAAQTAPVDLRQGDLVVAASTPAWAAQVRFLSAELVDRSNETLGSQVVRSVRIVVRPEASKPLGHKSSRGVMTGPERRSGPPSSDRI